MDKEIRGLGGSGNKEDSPPFNHLLDHITTYLLKRVKRTPENLIVVGICESLEVSCRVGL
jgi:hypothetical protein